MEGTEGPYSLVGMCHSCGGAFRVEKTQAAPSATLADPTCLPSYTVRSDYCTQPVGLHGTPSGFGLAKWPCCAEGLCLMELVKEDGINI